VRQTLGDEVHQRRATLAEDRVREVDHQSTGDETRRQPSTPDERPDHLSVLERALRDDEREERVTGPVEPRRLERGAVSLEGGQVLRTGGARCPAHVRCQSEETVEEELTVEEEPQRETHLIAGGDAAALVRATGEIDGRRLEQVPQEQRRFMDDAVGGRPAQAGRRPPPDAGDDHL
jgi:hypothetical protein